MAVLLGFKPSGNARGFGEVLDGQARVTYLGSFSSNVWVTKVGIRCGRNTGANAIVAPAIYDQAGANSAPTTLVHSPTAKTVSTAMVDNSGGVNLEFPVTGLPIAAGRTLGAGPWADAAGSSIGYGQNASGTRMYRDTNATSAPNDPWTNDADSPEGDIDVWIIGEANRKPVAAILDPPNGGVTVDPTPDITIGFSDPDESLGDEFGSWRIEVWNEDGSAKIPGNDSGVTTASAGEKTAGKATWTVPNALSADTYQIRATAYDRFGTPSTQVTSTFTYNAGGVYTANPIPNQAGTITSYQGKTFGTPVVVTNDDTPGPLSAVWDHDSALDADETDVIIKRIGLGAVSDGTPEGDATEAILYLLAGNYRPTYTDTTNVADDGTFNFNFTDPTPDWAALEPGPYAYRVTFAGTDALAAPAQAGITQKFVVNDPPSVTLDSPADTVSVAQRPTLEATIADTTDDAGSHTVTVEISTTGAFAGEEDAYPMNHVGSGVYRLITTATHLPILDDYWWRVVATDPWGATDTSATRSFSYVAAPAITSVVPVDDSTITTGTPTVTANVDRTITHERITVRAQGGTQIYYDSGEVATSGTTVSEAVPPAKLTNATDYDLDVWIRAADGLEATVTTQFRVEYVAPAAMTNVTYTAVASSIFDTGAYTQEPNVEIVHDPVSQMTVSDEDFIGYVYTWEAVGYDTVVWTEPNRNSVGMTDTRVPGGVLGTYTVQFEQWINGGIDVIRSTPVTADLTVDVQFVTITSENPNGLAVSSRTGRDRTVSTTPQKQYIEILGQPEVDEWVSPLVSKALEIELHWFDDRTGAWTARDAAATLLAMAEPDSGVNANGNPVNVPRVLYYRDRRGRAFRFSVQDVSEPDPNLLDQAVVRLRGRRIYEGS